MVSLISQTGGEYRLGQLFESHLQRLSPKSTSLTCFDYNRQSGLLGSRAFE
jgi:hypothetical protein